MAPPIPFRVDPEISGLGLLTIGILDTDYGVGAPRDLRPCHDSHGVARADGALEA
jgi:hypothetical protein